MKQITALIVLTLVLCTACNKTPKTESSTIANAPIVSDLTIADSTDFYTIRAHYPEVNLDTANIMKKFVEQRVAQRKEEWKTGGEIYKAEKEISKEFPNRASMKYDMIIDYDTIYSSKYKTATYVFTIGEYTGGANGSQEVKTFNFDQNKHNLQIEDILDLTNNNDIAICRLLLHEAEKDNELFSKDFVEQGLGLLWLKSDGITLDTKGCNCDASIFRENLQQFVIKDNGISFKFSKGIIAISAAGITEIFLSWDAIDPYLKKNGLI